MSRRQKRAAITECFVGQNQKYEFSSGDVLWHSKQWRQQMMRREIFNIKILSWIAHFNEDDDGGAALQMGQYQK